MYGVFDRVYEVKDYNYDLVGYTIGYVDKHWFSEDDVFYEPDPEKVDRHVIGVCSITNAKIYKTKEEAMRKVHKSYIITEITNG